MLTGLLLLQSRWRKRGLAVTPTKFGIAFTKLTYNQGGALVHVYTDGTVRCCYSGGPTCHVPGRGVQARASACCKGMLAYATVACRRQPCNSNSNAAGTSQQVRPKHNLYQQEVS